MKLYYLVLLLKLPVSHSASLRGNYRFVGNFGWKVLYTNLKFVHIGNDLSIRKCEPVEEFMIITRLSPSGLFVKANLTWNHCSVVPDGDFLCFEEEALQFYRGMVNIITGWFLEKYVY